MVRLVEHYESVNGNHEGEDYARIENEKVAKKRGVREAVDLLTRVVTLN